MGLLILSSGAVIALPFTNLITIFIFLLICYQLLIVGQVRKITLSFLLLLLLILLSISITLLVNEDFKSFSSYANLMFRITLLAFAVLFFTSEEPIEIYNKYIVFLAAVSLVIFPLILINQDLPLAFPQFEQYGNTYHNLFFYIASYYEGEVVGHNRNQSIFWEAGAFQSLLSLALFFEIYYFKKIRRINIGILIVAILTTQSTTGYLILSGFFFLYLFFNESNQKTSFLTKFSFVFFTGLFIASSGFFLTNIVEKFNADNLSNLSRLVSLKTDIEIFLSYPLTGSGYTIYDMAVTEISSETYGIQFEGSVSPLSKQFAVYGILFMIPILFLYYKLIDNIVASKIATPIIFGMILLILATEGFIVSPLWLFLGFSGLLYKK